MSSGHAWSCESYTVLALAGVLGAVVPRAPTSRAAARPRAGRRRRRASLRFVSAVDVQASSAWFSIWVRAHLARGAPASRRRCMTEGDPLLRRRAWERARRGVAVAMPAAAREAADRWARHASRDLILNPDLSSPRRGLTVACGAGDGARCFADTAERWLPPGGHRSLTLLPGHTRIARVRRILPWRAGACYLLSRPVSARLFERGVLVKYVDVLSRSCGAQNAYARVQYHASPGDWADSEFRRPSAAPSRSGPVSPTTAFGLIDLICSTIARNLLADWVRMRGRELPELEVEHAEMPTTGELESGLPPAELAVVERYLAGLDWNLAAVYQQRYTKGVSQEEAAQALGLSRQRVRTLEEKLRQGSRKALRKAEIVTPR